MFTFRAMFTRPGLKPCCPKNCEKAIGVDAEQWLPAGSSAIAAVVDKLYLDRVDQAVG